MLLQTSDAVSRDVRAKAVKGTKWVLSAVAIAAIAFLGFRIYVVQSGLPLERWHTYVPRELRANEIDAADWNQYLAEEARVFESVRTEVTQKLDPQDRVALNRYFDGSPVYPPHFTQDFNRSYVLEPAGAPIGAAVLLHGLTDSPYSQRHIARAYRDRGYVAIVIRLPAHGTVPAALTDVEWEDWLAATRLAVREARRRVGPHAPLHLVGFSNGGALALKYALDAIADPQLSRPDRLVLISPMIGITRFARFAGLAGVPAIFPAFAKAAWLSVVPEFNPFKYNSFPVNGARQSYRLTQVLQEQTARYARNGQLAQLPPIITFQSVMDFTVSTSAIVSALYAHLPSNGSELVLFDVNRTVKFGPLLRRSADTALTRLLPAGAQSYRTTIITNADSESYEAAELTTEAGSTTEHSRRLGLTYPVGLYSLSHVALPFPMTDALYGLTPDPTENFGINLGALAPRGERNVLIASLDALLRISSNPFFPYMLGRIEECIDATTAGATNAPAVSLPQRSGKTGDEDAHWGFDDVIAFIKNSIADRSDTSPDDPP
ncbi:MAG TPA: alpha/beta hydrolase [Alphaproteobacteria bacterium]|nr:alpha/beta hydrolase [Alphaproteobacteria bacterium]